MELPHIDLAVPLDFILYKFLPNLKFKFWLDSNREIPIFSAISADVQDDTLMKKRENCFPRTTVLQVNLCQKHSFLRQLTHNMMTDCSWKLQAQNMLKTCCEQKLFFFVFKFITNYVHMFWSCNFHGLVNARIRVSEKVLPVLSISLLRPKIMNF